MVPGRNPHTGKPQGMVQVNVPGSNGGVRRGPDLGLRRHLIRGLLLEAMAREGQTLESLREEPQELALRRGAALRGERTLGGRGHR